MEYALGIPDEGGVHLMRVEFQNCRLTTEAEILDIRRSSSNLPAGFGVNFTGLSDDSREVINRIVKNALIRKLLDHETHVEIPSIRTDDITLQFDLS